MKKSMNRYKVNIVIFPLLLVIVSVCVTCLVSNLNLANIQVITRIGNVLSRVSAPLFCKEIYQDEQHSWLCNGFSFPYNDVSGVTNCLKLGIKYEPWMYKIIQAYSNYTIVAIDVGAHIGYHTRHLAMHFKHVYAFEPNGVIFHHLAANAPQNVTCINAGVGSVDDKLHFVKDAMSSRSYVLDTNDCGSNCVKVVKLDDVVSQPVGLVKIDVEGGEIHVIMGMERIIRNFKPIIIFEDHIGDTVKYVKQTYNFYNIERINASNFVAIPS